MKTSRNSIPLDNRWFKRIKDKEEQESLKKSIHNSLVSDTCIKRLREILEEELQIIERTELELDQYDNPSWAYKQAHINGRKAELLNIRKLLTNE